MRVTGNPVLAMSLGEELTITNLGVEAEVIRGLNRVKMTVPYDRIAQVTLTRGIAAAQLEVVNKGGADNVLVRGLHKSDAERAKRLIEQNLVASHDHPAMVSAAPLSTADEIHKLLGLRAAGVLNDAEFEAAKAQLLRGGAGLTRG